MIKSSNFLVIMKIQYYFILLFMFAIHTDGFAENIYLSKLSFVNEPILSTVFKEVIHKCDSLKGNKRYAFSVGMYIKDDDILVDFEATYPKYLVNGTNLIGFTIINNRYFFIYCDRDLKNVFTKSSQKFKFTIKDKKKLTELGRHTEWYYLISNGESYKSLTFDEFSKVAMEFLFK